jgi:hypothetical protein
MTSVIVDDQIYRYICPHCNLWIEVKDLNCCIFRHGAYIGTYEPINPHASQQEVQSLKDAGKIVGCGGPHKLEMSPSGEWTVRICSWDS